MLSLRRQTSTDVAIARQCNRELLTASGVYTAMPPHYKLLTAAALIAAVAIVGPSITSACEKISDCPKTSELRASLRIDANLVATVKLKSIAERTLTVATHVQTHEIHYDWLTFEVAYPVSKSDEGCENGNYRIAKQTIRPTGARDKSYRAS